MLLKAQGYNKTNNLRRVYLNEIVLEPDEFSIYDYHCCSCVA